MFTRYHILSNQVNNHGFIKKEFKITNAKVSIEKLNRKQTDIRGEFWLNIFSYFLLNINKELINNIKRVLFWNFLIVEAA